MTRPVLVTDRLVLRPHEMRHLEPSVAMWGSPNVTRHIGGKTRSRQETWFTICRMRGMWDLLGYSYWAIENRQTGQFLGECGFSDFMRGMKPDLSEWPEAGWVFAEAAWGKGYASEAVTAMHDWLDENRPGQSVCIINPENTGSQRVAEKCGYEFWQTSEYGGAAVNVFRRTAGNQLA
ncbi:MAG: GNAT family N-acetyltransferase [Hyphomonas sp.]|nr:GNAT family N-acetyltransferase [Hyphomonas sp.]